jgi:hypothetical protein
LIPLGVALEAAEVESPVLLFYGHGGLAGSSTHATTHCRWRRVLRFPRRIAGFESHRNVSRVVVAGGKGTGE